MKFLPYYLHILNIVLQISYWPDVISGVFIGISIGAIVTMLIDDTKNN